MSQRAVSEADVQDSTCQLIISDCDHQNQAGRNQATRPQQIEINPVLAAVRIRG